MPSSHSSAAPPDGKPSRLARVRRKPDRARYDMLEVHALLDAAPFCHVATIRYGRPVVLPMAHGRLGDTLILHGSPAAGLFRDARTCSPVCVTATLLDGLVFARSARNHSMNYRSVTIHGHATPVSEPGEILAGLRAVVDHVAQGRWEEVRKPTAAELRETALWQVSIEAASVKSRRGSTLDPECDQSLPVWAGHIPALLTFGEPVPAEGLPPGIELPGYLRALLAAGHPASSSLATPSRGTRGPAGRHGQAGAHDGPRPAGSGQLQRRAAFGEGDE